MYENKKLKSEEVFLFMFMLHYRMFKGKKFLSSMAFVIGGVIGASMLTYFSFAQNYDELIWSNLVNRIFSFIMPKHDVYLYAVTEPNTYTVHFDENWWTWHMEDMTLHYDQVQNLIPNSFTKEWRSFKWWSRTETWDVEFLDQTEVLNLTSTDLSVVTLYAQWETGISYIIEYCLEDLEWSWCNVVGTGIGYTTDDFVVISTWNEYEWFTLKTWDVVSVVSGWTVQYYYIRNAYDLTVRDRDTTRTYTWIKYETDIRPILPESLTWWTWNTFSWWIWVPEGGLMPAHDVEVTSDWTYWVHSIEFDSDWWTDVPTITGNYGDPILVPENPTKEWYEFVRWEPELPSTMPYDDMVVKAIWKEVKEEWGWWWSGWWGRWWGGWGWWWDSSGESSWDDQHGAAMERTSEVVDKNRVSLEVLIAYMWARSKWIIDTARKDSDPDGYIPRWDMAEMVVKFTENVLWRKIPAIPAKCEWWDPEIDWLRPETKVYAQKACALWVMWIRMENFLPNKLIDRAEFWTILSRLLWWDKYDVVDATATKLYYTRHLDALNREWIMTQIDNPVSRYELRKWAWLMLMRVKT